MTTTHKCFKYFNLEGARIPIEDFVLAWQKSASTREVCERLKVQVPTDKTCAKIANKAYAMRRKGVRLKPYSRNSNSYITKDDIAILNDLIASLKT